MSIEVEVKRQKEEPVRQRVCSTLSNTIGEIKWYN